MLDKLVVSKNSTKENRRIGNFLVTSFLAMAAVLTVGMIYSLFSYNLAMGNDNLNISTLVAPVIETEFEPKPINKTPKNKKSNSDKTDEITRKTNTLGIDENPQKIPDKVSVKPSDVKSRPNQPFRLSTVDSGESIFSDFSNRRNSNISSNSGIADSGVNAKSSEIIAVKSPEIKKPPALKKEPKSAAEKKEPPTMSGGVINGKAINLVTPAYSQAARAMNITGKVTVQVLIDENGSVVSAEAVEGHALLRPAAVRAARISKFSPTYLSKQKVKVSGVIVYKFTK